MVAVICASSLMAEVLILRPSWRSSVIPLLKMTTNVALVPVHVPSGIAPAKSQFAMEVARMIMHATKWESELPVAMTCMLDLVLAKGTVHVQIWEGHRAVFHWS